MKIQNIINEDIGADLAFKQLSALQIGLLRKVSEGRFDYESASTAAQDAIESLIGLGLVDELSMDITDKGSQALSMAANGGSEERRNLGQARQRSADQPIDREPTEDFDID
jgi:hypothetical protein